MNAMDLEAISTVEHLTEYMCVCVCVCVIALDWEGRYSVLQPELCE